LAGFTAERKKPRSLHLHRSCRESKRASIKICVGRS
jgi:hypothetical protein